MASGRGSHELSYHVVDVFASQRFAGNPLAVVLDGDALATSQMQQLAREFHLSETAFPLQPTDSQKTQGADYFLRIFTPEVEIPFAGHPSIGTAWLLHQLGRLPSGEVRQLCGEGLLPVSVNDRSATLTGGPPVVGDPVDAAPILAAVGLSAVDLRHPPRIATTGLPYAILPVRVEALERCQPDLALLSSTSAFPDTSTGVYVVAWQDNVRRIKARMFAGDIGVPEDPATGSAALALGAYLAQLGLLPAGSQTVDVEQGVAMGRPSQLHVQIDIADGRASRVRVSGDVVRVADGRILIP
ncbi:MAG: PhzF family phenazine biosynthesis protein [Candidatus Nanopelagicales bacterium]